MSPREIRCWGAWLGLVALGAGAQACGDDSAEGGGGAAGSGAKGSGGTSAAAGGMSSAGKPSGSGGKASGGKGGATQSQGGAEQTSGGKGGATQSQGGAEQTSGASSGGAAADSSGGAAGGGDSGSGMKSNGCGQPAPLAEAAQRSVTIGADVRGYFLAPPAGYDSKTAYALVFAYHGSGGNGSGLRGYFGLEAASNAQAIFVYPDGLGGIWDLKNDGADAKLFDSVLATLEEAWCIDKGAVFTAGFSYGGWAATQMAKARPAVVRGVASIEGGGPQGGSSKDAAVAAIIVHGSNDTAEPLASGESSRDHFLATNGCGASSTDVAPAPCKTYAGCMAGKSVEWCEHTGAHEVPSFAPAGIWSFFSSLR